MALILALQFEPRKIVERDLLTNANVPFRENCKSLSPALCNWSWDLGIGRTRVVEARQEDEYSVGWKIAALSRDLKSILGHGGQAIVEGPRAIVAYAQKLFLICRCQS